MRDLSESELLSAYLDGELTAAERVRAEQMIQQSAAARQLVEDMRALGEGLRGLPRRRVGVDLGPRVLRRAERQILSEPVRAALGGAEPLDRLPVWRRVLSTRNLVWAGLAVGIALALVLVDQGRVARPGGRPIAVKPDMPPKEIHKPPAVPMPEKLRRPDPGNLGEQAPGGAAPKAPADSKVERGRPSRQAQVAAVVSCAATREALRDGALQQALARHRVTVRSKTILDDSASFLAEITPTQLDAVLNDLRARPEAFLEVPPMPSLSSASPLGPGAAGLSYRVQRSPGPQTGAAVPHVPAQNESKYLVRFELRVGGAR